MKNNRIFLKGKRVKVVSVKVDETDHWSCLEKECKITSIRKITEKERYRGSPVIARNMYRAICQERIENGWKDIEKASVSNSISISTFQEFLEREDVDDKVKSSPDYVPVKDDELKEVEAVCVDNEQLEENFTKGVTYVVIERGGFVDAYDKYGSVIFCSADRFERVENEDMFV